LAFKPEEVAEESLKAIREEVGRRSELAKARVNEAYNEAARRVEALYEEAARRFAERLRG
jgi:phosphoribosylaminoimidazole-succinocarboxamide synthase